ncbi:efflux RND transporter permease subunit [Pseudoteredinibacter isoporae]|uniref:Multidrug efflux pump subunit AcrB n=1 Tax=Pseudoteredinibacter isoporae TaxID=570281 RepID=A0A7X0JT98_9GAMM|nr:efflux RND transporter permease subunit [Pseudoteredinibacter isoporae]MBB6521829.1 multidrug efflux pump subunit AcrB [Pseudoteredinibacter isoporae]NHO87374.1 efflux RND transporter permease subunit [Pseudoteredinibacter isoporae]NIB23198.1 efflux RND transporter permease subunit [Pseudoteredinibacter isoporae]
MIAAAAKRGLLVAVLVLISTILGIVAAMKIPVQMIPDLEVRSITVQTGWPGATPQDVEKEILIEQERYLRSLPNLQRMVSRADMGRATIELEFPFGTNVNDALIRVNNALSQVPSYPENVDQPRLFSSSFSSNAFMFFLLQPLEGNPLQLDVDLLRDFAEDFVRPRMESVTGVSEVRVNGGARRQIQIKVDADRLAQRGISLADVRSAVRDRNRDASAGDIESGKSRYLLRVVGRFEQLKELKQLIVKRQGDANILLQDIAEVELDHFESRGLSYADGERTLRLSVRRESGSNVLAIKDQILPLVEELNSQLLAQNGLQLRLLSDDVTYVKSSLENVWFNLALGALLATLVMYYFLRSGRATLVGVFGIPLCTIAAFIGLLAFSRTINVISLAGVAFAIGMTVDNTIVVLESIVQAKQKGRNKLDAVIKGVQDVWPAVLASTATTVLVFAPILFVVEEAGQLYSDIAIAIAAAIIASMLIAIFVVPVALAQLRSRSDLKPNRNYKLSPRWLSLVNFVTASKSRARMISAAIAGGILLSAYVLMPAAEYLPEGEEPKAFSMMIAPPDYNLSQMESIATELRAYFKPYLDQDINAFEPEKDAMPPMAYYSMTVSAGRIWFLSAPKDPNNIGAMMTGITEKFKSYSGMRAFSSRGSIISSNDGGTRAVAVDIAGNNTVELYRAAEAVYQQAEIVFDKPQINSEPRSLSLDQPLIEIKPRWNRLAELNIRNQDFNYAVAALSDGAYVDEFILDDDKVDIFLFSGAGTEQSLDQLAATPMVSPGGSILPLGALADLVESKNSNSVRRVDGNRTVTVYIIPPREVALETAEALVREELIPSLWQAGKIAQGIKLGISGAADQLEATRSSLSSNFAIALILIYLLLVAIFSHWQMPLFILATVPLGMAGGLLGLIAANAFGSLGSAMGFAGFHQPFDMITMLGFLILLGTVVNNPILIVDQTRRFMDEGVAVQDAVRQAVSKRLKPILMSTATTLFGLAPLVLIPGEGTELYRGVGIIVLCGILASTVLSLSFLPALLLALMPEKNAKLHKGEATPAA